MIVRVAGYRVVPSASLIQMKAAVSSQPVTVAIDANSLQFQMLSSSSQPIDESFPCSQSSPNLAVTIVGYTSNSNWIVQNSWGPQWGNSGYFKVKMTDGAGVCGINMYGVYP